MPDRRGSAVVTLPSPYELRVTRVFDAPAELVFEVWARPEHVRRWWGYEAATMLVCEADVRVGGAWRTVTREVDGRQVGWHGTYLELDPPRRLVRTEAFEGGGEVVSTVELVEPGDGTTVLSLTVRCGSRQERDDLLASGMERGMQVSLDRAEALLAAAARGGA
jgi:uncharacterized protein YndB with AHSA1/START domain